MFSPWFSVFFFDRFGGAGQDNLFGDWACMRTVLQEGQGFGSLGEGSEVGRSSTSYDVPYVPYIITI